MQIFTNTSRWLRSHTATPTDDFRAASETSHSAARKVAVGAAVGAGIGAAAGGGYAYHSVSKDFEYFEYLTEQVPLAASGPEALDVFGQDLARYQGLVGNHSEGASSSQETLKYLAYLQHQNPQAPAAEIQGIYQALESQFGHDQQVRQALNMISAHVQKHGTSPNEAYREFTNHFGYETDFSRASSTFAQDQGLSSDDLNMTNISLVKRHSSPLGHLGMGRAVALGLVTGAAIGAATGVAVGVGLHVLDKITQ